MSENSVLLKYFPFEKQLELTQQLIEDGDLEQALEIVDITGIDLSTDTQLIDRLFQRSINHIDSFLDKASIPMKSVQETLLQDNEFPLLMKFVSSVPVLKNKLDQLTLDLILTFIRTTKERLFDDKLYSSLVKPLLADIKKDDFDSSYSKRLNDTQLVLLLQLLEIIYIQDENKHDKVFSISTDNCLIAFLGCNVEGIALQSSQLLRWRQSNITQCCLSSPNVDRTIWSYLIELYTNNNDCNWKLRNSLIFLLRSISNDTLSAENVQFIQSDGFWIGLQFALNHDITEYRKLALSILKKIIDIVSSSDSLISTATITPSYFKWNIKDQKKYQLNWKKFITLYENVALDTNLDEIQKVEKDIINIFNDSFIPESWGLIVCSTGLKSSMENIKEYVVSLMLGIKNKAVFSTNLPLLRATLLPSLMNSDYFSTSCDQNKAIDDNCCQHGTLVCDLFKEILVASENNDSQVLTILLQSIIDTKFVPAKIYCCKGIYDYAKGHNNQLFNSSHFSLLTKLFESRYDDPILDTTLKTYLFKMLNYVNEQESSPSEWISCMGSHLENCKCAFNHFDTRGISTFHVTISDERYKDVKKLLKNKIGSDAMYDALCVIYFNIQPMQYSKELQAVLLKLTINAEVEWITWDMFDTAFEKNLSCLLSQETLKRYDMDTLYEYGSEVVASNYKPAARKPFDFEMVLDFVISFFSPQKLQFLANMCKTCDKKELRLTDKFQQLHSIMATYLLENDVSNITKDNIHANLVILVREKIPWEGNWIEYLDEMLPLVKEISNTDSPSYRNYTEIASLCFSIYDHEKVEGSTVYVQCFEILSTIWKAINDKPVTQNKRDLQFKFLDCIFTPINIYMAVSTPGSSMKETLDEYIKQVCNLGFSQRGFLPLLAQKFSLFMTIYNQELTHMSDLTWLMSSLILIFTQGQSRDNIFSLESVIAYLYDDELSTNEKKSKSLYKKVYDYPEFYSKLFIISALVNSEPKIQRTFIDYLLKEGNIVLSNSIETVPDENERISKWQLMLTSLYVYSKREQSLEMKYFIRNILQDLEMENSGDIRIYKEWMIAYYFASEYANNINDLEDLLFSLLIDHSKPFLVVSVERILFLVIKAQNENVSKKLLNRFISVLVPNATSNKPLVRHFSNSLITLFWPMFEAKLQAHNMKDILVNLYHNAKIDQTGGVKARSGDAKVWDLYDDFTLSGIFGGVTEEIIGSGQMQISSQMFREFDKNNKLDHVFQITSPKNQSQHHTPITNNYAKIRTYSTKSVQRSDLIVVASLVDKPFNLGGICRLSDVLGAKVVTMQDLKVVSHPQFKNVALSSDRWMPMEEVPINSIAEYMHKKKAEGYTLIGLEQTDKSIRLDEKYIFPSKSLILLGTEAYGIPGPLLGELDLCLEIQQHGVIRSMNIQTATAVIVHSYTIQHL